MNKINKVIIFLIILVIVPIVLSNALKDMEKVNAIDFSKYSVYYEAYHEALERIDCGAYLKELGKSEVEKVEGQLFKDCVYRESLK